jgi:4-hydroxyphenylacetate 3-monooxygenase
MQVVFLKGKWVSKGRVLEPLIPVRDGQAYIESLRDGRCIRMNGRVISDVTSDSAFRNAAAAFGRLYDFQASPDNMELMTFVSPTSGGRVNRSWELPLSLDDLVRRRKAIEAWSSLNFGWLGRSPDHLATALSGIMMGESVMTAYGAERAAAFREYFAFARDRDLFVTYVIQNPQADKSKSTSRQAAGLVLHVVDEDASGIIVDGAKMLGTSSAMSNEIFAGTVQPLQEGEEKYAVSFAIPTGTKGVTLLSRRSYEEAVSSSYDYPLSSHFDENDAVIVFNEVKVPWERVFVYRDVRAAYAQWHETPAHVYQNYQSQIRFSVKLRFLAGLARRVAEVNGSAQIPQVRDKLAQLAADALIVEGMVAGMEAQGRRAGQYWVPSAPLLYAAQTFAQNLYPRFIDSLRDLCGGGVLMLPATLRDIEDAETYQLIEATQVSPATDALGRIGVLKLAWDALGSEFAARHIQYEMFYAGASYVNLANVARTYDWAAAADLVRQALALSSRPSKPAAKFAAE